MMMRPLDDDEMLAQLDSTGHTGAARRMREQQREIAQLRADRNQCVADVSAALGPRYSMTGSAAQAARCAIDLIADLETQLAAAPSQSAGISDADADQLNDDISAAYGLSAGSLGWADVCAIKLGTEAGEAQDAWLRLSGRSRKPGTREELEAEIADVEICNRMLARAHRIDLAAAVRAKLSVVRARGSKEQGA